VTTEELYAKLDAINKGFPASGFDAVSDSVIADLSSCASEAGGLGMKSGKEVLDNLVAVLKARKSGEKADESVTIRLTALDFYIDKLRSGDTSDL